MVKGAGPGGTIWLDEAGPKKLIVNKRVGATVA
jgi:hypothetical protein